jgi:hypothetical protein
MVSPNLVRWLLTQEARGLLTRLERVQPFALHMTMVPAAAVPPIAQSAMENHLGRTRRHLRAMVYRFIHWLREPSGSMASPAEAQRRFTILRMRFNAILAHFEIFADVLTQRSEHETGVWVAGLDDVAADALELPGNYFQAPPIVCYVNRGPGAAIRRAQTRLPGGDPNPVAIISVPRERMIGSGIASSLVHEVGHQAATLLDLANSLRPALRIMQRNAAPNRSAAWRLLDQWISEIVADFWAVAKLGITATMGLMGVVSVPRSFIFRMIENDPHPFPWIRMKLSCALGQALYPHSQWNVLSTLWENLYPREGLAIPELRRLAALEATLPGFVSLLIDHRPRALGGKSLREVMPIRDRTPMKLENYFRTWGHSIEKMRTLPPTLAFAVIGQAHAWGQINAEEESETLAKLLTYWAERSALDMSEICASIPHQRRSYQGLAPTNGHYPISI